MKSFYYTDEQCKAIEARFWAKVNKTESCWIWTAGKYINGYGQFMIGTGHPIRAHIFSYIQAKGGVPKGLCVLHKCDNPACVNPEHLFAGTNKRNTQDCIEKGRFCKGSKSPRAVLTEELVSSLREEYKTSTAKQLVAKYNLNINTVWSAVNSSSNRNWKHV